MNDITELVQAQKALDEIRQQLENRQRFITSIVESIPSSLVVIDRMLRIVSANSNFLVKSRRVAQDTLGRKIKKVFPPVLIEYAQLDRKIREVFSSGTAAEGGKVAYRAPGLPTRIYFYRLIPLMAKGTVENVMLLMDDITEREQLGEDVRRAERHLAGVVECANDLVISLDPEGRILTWNQAAENTSGLESEQVRDKSLVSLCVAEEQPVMGEMLRRLADGERVKNIEVNLLTASDRQVPIAWSCSTMFDDARKLTGIVAVGRDLTERRRLEAQLAQAAMMTSLGGMAGGIAHEVRNPLGIISACSQLLLERADDAKLRGEAAEKIHAATQRASSIIENLMKFARPHGTQMGEVDVHAVLQVTLSLLAHQMALERISLKKNLEPDLPRVHGNPDLLRQVFTNLILNSGNAMPQGGTLTVTTRTTERGRSNRFVEILFSDNGCGIPQENLSRIFDPFFTTMPVGTGVGLGLSICYSIIQQHQGTIGVTSRPGQETTFTIRLPACEV